MDDRLTHFLRYDYVEAKDMAKAFLTVAAVLLGAGIAFAEKFIKLGETDQRKILHTGMVGLYALAAAVVMSGLNLYNCYTSMIDVLRHHEAGILDARRFAGDVARFDEGLEIWSLISIVSIAIGLFCLVKAAIDNSPARRSTDTLADRDAGA